MNTILGEHLDCCGGEGVSPVTFRCKAICNNATNLSQQVPCERVLGPVLGTPRWIKAKLIAGHDMAISRGHLTHGKPAQGTCAARSQVTCRRVAWAGNFASLGQVPPML